MNATTVVADPVHHTGARRFWASLTASQRRTLTLMVVVVVGLHVAGVVTLLALVSPAHHHLARAGRSRSGSV